MRTVSSVYSGLVKKSRYCNVDSARPYSPQRLPMIAPNGGRKKGVEREGRLGHVGANPTVIVEQEKGKEERRRREEEEGGGNWAIFLRPPPPPPFPLWTAAAAAAAAAAWQREDMKRDRPRLLAGSPHSMAGASLTPISFLWPRDRTFIILWRVPNSRRLFSNKYEHEDSDFLLYFTCLPLFQSFQI